MRRNHYLFVLFAFVVAAGLQLCDLHAATPASFLTAREQGLLLRGAGMSGERVTTSRNRFLADVEQTIRRANPGLNSQSLRQPVSEAALRNLQMRSALRGNLISQSELRAATDYAHALLVEANGKASLAEKVNKLPEQLRKPFHGKVAELAEARARGMVLNKSATATTWDLTEAKFQPRNYQMKIYAQHDKALSSMLDDLDKKLDFNKRGITTKDTLERGVKSGQLVRDGSVYRPVGRADVELHPSKVFSRPAESHLYAKTGRGSLIKRGLTAKAAPSGFQTAGKLLGRAGFVALVATEGYVIQGFATGRLSEREFVTAQSSIAGGGIGAWAGVKAGAAIGLFIAGGPEDPLAVITVPAGAVVGGIVGGFSGAKLGEVGASGFYGRLDKNQKRQVEAFVYQHYGISQ
jgi:hypothetical protein